MSMESKYSPKEVEAKWEKLHREGGAFKPAGEGKPYTIVIPPPNVTGALHMGHALNHTIQDVLVRFERLQAAAASHLRATLLPLLPGETAATVDKGPAAGHLDRPAPAPRAGPAHPL